MIMKKLIARRGAAASNENDNGPPARKVYEKDGANTMIFITIGNTSGRIKLESLADVPPTRVVSRVPPLAKRLSYPPVIIFTVRFLISTIAISHALLQIVPTVREARKDVTNVIVQCARSIISRH